jgi:hypothetical protein
VSPFYLKAEPKQEAVLHTIGHDGTRIALVNQAARVLTCAVLCLEQVAK